MGGDNSTVWSIWKIVLIVEWACLLIGLAFPIMPSKTGGGFSFADWFFDDPSYMQEVLVYFIFSNLFFGVVALIALVMLWKERRAGTDDQPPTGP
ncbi:MAG: hypothetical protein GTO46_08265 [Gemmatimonadetes bacterium]|nr:hypothetical protein [Gemmatimonadota bacterium]NIO31636.1 hypothetical protein [Gemmatimonadota bacterium]